MADDDDLPRRSLQRRATREAGDRSGRISRELMKASDSLVARLEISESLRDAITQARAITSQIARRRAERALAGSLRAEDLRALDQQLANLRATGAAVPERLHLAERWRTRLLEEGLPALPELPGGDPEHVLPGLMAQARRERDTGKPPGAQRALFRAIIERLEASEAAGDDTDEPADADETDA
jgi:ribosome-associated protein